MSDPNAPAEATSPPAPPAGRPRPLLAYGLAALVIVLDQLSKAWIVHGLHFVEGSSLPLVGPLRLTFVYNQGISFGLLQGSGLGRWLLAAFSAAVAIALIIWARRAGRLWLTVGIGLVAGGAIGNLVDRVLIGQVIDFIDVSAIGFFPWVFNIADSAINVGVAILLIDQLFTPDRKPPA